MTTITLDYKSAIEHCFQTLGHPQGTKACIAFVRGAEWAIDQMVAPATAPEQCWCRTCRPITQADNRMVLCPDCGNKRCPKATDHRNACTGSNEPGQPGSSYPTVPATAPEQPAWHDAPTVPGLRVCNYGALSVTAVNQPDIDAFDPAYNAGGRWFGPIPEDKS